MFAESEAPKNLFLNNFLNNKIRKKRGEGEGYESWGQCKSVVNKNQNLRQKA